MHLTFCKITQGERETKKEQKQQLNSTINKRTKGRLRRMMTGENDSLIPILK